MIDNLEPPPLPPLSHLQPTPGSLQLILSASWISKSLRNPPHIFAVVSQSGSFVLQEHTLPKRQWVPQQNRILKDARYSVQAITGALFPRDPQGPKLTFAPSRGVLPPSPWQWEGTVAFKVLFICAAHSFCPFISQGKPCGPTYLQGGLSYCVLRRGDPSIQWSPHQDLKHSRTLNLQGVHVLAFQSVFCLAPP